MNFHIHKWEEVKAFYQAYESHGKIVLREHCAKGFECAHCKARKVKIISYYKEDGKINPILWQEILDWKNQKPTQATILKLVKRTEG